MVVSKTMSDDFSEDPNDPDFGQRCFGLLFSVWRSPQWISDLSHSIEEKIGGTLLYGDGPLQIIRERKQPICTIYLGSRVIAVAKLLGVQVNSATKICSCRRHFTNALLPSAW